MDEPRNDPAGEARGPRPGEPGQPGSRLDGWLSGHVQPLPPPPGTLERIRQRARRRKLARAAVSAAGAAVVITGLATIPVLVRTQPPEAMPARRATTGHKLAPLPSQAATVPPLQASSSGPVPVAILPPVPPGFAPTSVTFVGTETGWVIGQAGVRGQCTGPDPGICTSIARTDDGGRSWYGVPAPVTGPPDGSKGVSQVRFLNTADGWAFGPELWATHDGGQHWTQIPTHGLRVTALKTRGSAAYAVWARCSGRGARFAADCTSFALYSSPAGSDHWQPVHGAARRFAAAGAPSPVPLLLLTGGASYLLPPSGVLLTGPASAAGRWRPAGRGPLKAAPCQPGAPGERDGALLAAQRSGQLVMLCPGSGAAWQSYLSSDGGRTWQLAGQAVLPGTPVSLASTPTGVLVAGTSRGISISTDHGASWQPAQVAGAPPGGFRYVGMTTPDQGVAVPADARQHAVWFTYDGGQVWRPSRVG